MQAEDKKKECKKHAEHILPRNNERQKDARSFTSPFLSYGSSASSSVAAALATNDLLEQPFQRDSKQILEAVVHGEYVATKGSPHGDNVFVSLLGGFIVIYDFANREYFRAEGGDRVYLVAASPTNLRVDTSAARAALKFDKKGLAELSAKYLKDCWIQDRALDTKGYVDGMAAKLQLHCGDGTLSRYLSGGVEVIRGIQWDYPRELGEAVNKDNIVTPVRANFITGYHSVAKAVGKAGAYGFGISGSGPAVFAVTDEKNAHNVAEAARKTFSDYGVNAEVHVSKINNLGAQRI